MKARADEETNAAANKSSDEGNEADSLVSRSAATIEAETEERKLTTKADSLIRPAEPFESRAPMARA